MKKRLVKIAAVFGVFCVVAVAFAATVTNQGQVITVQTLPDAAALSTLVNERAGIFSPVIVTTNPFPTVVSFRAFKPDFVGQLLVTTATSTVFRAAISYGVTTNDWAAISP